MSNRHPISKFNHDQLDANTPDELKRLKQWVVYEAKSRGINDKPTKIPKNPRTLRNASTSDPTSWGTYQEAAKACKANPTLNGIGVVLTEHDEYTGVDLDGVICKKSGDLSDTALEIVSTLGSYTEISPSGTGLHVIVRAKLPPNGNRRGSVEMYDQGRFLTFTGDVYKGHTKIAANQTGVDTVHARWIHRKATSTALSAHSSLESINDVMAALRSSEFAAIENTLKGDLDTYKSPSEAEFAVCCALISIGASDDQIDFIIRHSEICRAKWTDSRGDSTYGAITIKNARLSVNQGPDQESELINALNQRFAIARYGSSVGVIDECNSDCQDTSIRILTVAAFRTLTANRPTINKRTAAGIWLTSDKRREYLDLVFDPSCTSPPTSYNLFKGFAVKPKKGNCTLYKRFVRDIICNGDTSKYGYVLQWMAFLVQKPSILPEVALVLRGDQGTGKNTFIAPLLEIAGPHGIEVSTTEQLVGRFTGHLEDKLLVHANESIWGGNKQTEGALKTLITEKQRATERKGLDIVTTKNCAHVIVSSNEDWAVPAAPGQRRFVFLNVSNACKESHSYFKKIYDELASGGTAALLYELQAMELEDWHPRQRPPDSDGNDVALISSCSVTRWWHQCLEDGKLLGHSTMLLSEADDEYPTEPLTKTQIFDAYVSYCKALGERATQRAVFFKRFRSMIGGFDETRSKSSNGQRARQIGLPELSAARKAFTRNKGITFDE